VETCHSQTAILYSYLWLVQVRYEYSYSASSSGPSSNWKPQNPDFRVEADAFGIDVSQLAAYDAIKAQLVASGYFADTISTHLTTGVLAGTLATTVAAPFDVLKSRIQSAQKSGPGAGVGAILREGWRNEGARFLFRGWTPAWLRLT
jgi:dicarboxylate transporter 10